MNCVHYQLREKTKSLSATTSSFWVQILEFCRCGGRAEKQCQKSECVFLENNEHCAYIVYNQTFALRSYITEFHFPQRKKRHSNTWSEIIYRVHLVRLHSVIVLPVTNMMIFIPQLTLQKERTECSARNTVTIFMMP